MTYLPGQDEAILPGTNHITADRVVEDDRHLVVLDLSPTAYPLDGFMATLARQLADVGLLDEFCVLGRNRSSHPRVKFAVDSLEAEPSIARLLKFTLTPEDAERHRHRPGRRRPRTRGVHVARLHPVPRCR